MSTFLERVFLCVCAFVALVMIFAIVPAHAQIIRKDGVLPALAGLGYEPFGLPSAMAPAGTMWLRWREFDAGVARSAEAIAQCRAAADACEPATRRLVELIDSVRNVEGRAKFGLVNRALNLTIAYTSDTHQHGASDVWSNTLATLTSGQGDCEDYAIAKYLTLREAGVPTQDLRLLVGRLPYGEAHAVLAARLDGRWIILDNRRMAMVDDVYATDLQPLFAFDELGVKQFGAPVITVADARDAEQAVAPAAPVSGRALPADM